MSLNENFALIPTVIKNGSKYLIDTLVNDVPVCSLLQFEDAPDTAALE